MPEPESEADGPCKRCGDKFELISGDNQKSGSVFTKDGVRYQRWKRVRRYVCVSCQYRVRVSWTDDDEV